VQQGREVRKAMGGGWRQCGYLAAACLYAVHHNVARLKEDHEYVRNSLEKESSHDFVQLACVCVCVCTCVCVCVYVCVYVCVCGKLVGR
jgi:hypothetical protein